MKILCPNCKNEISVNPFKLGEEIYCKNCTERFKLELPQSSFTGFIFKIILAAGLVASIWAVIKVEFMPRWLYLLLVLIFFVFLWIVCIDLNELILVKKRNKRLLREKNEKKK